MIPHLFAADIRICCRNGGTSEQGLITDCFYQYSIHQFFRAKNYPHAENTLFCMGISVLLISLAPVNRAYRRLSAANALLSHFVLHERDTA